LAPGKRIPGETKVSVRSPKAEGSKAGTGGKVAKLIVAISHGKGMLICERYEKMHAQYFTHLIDQYFDTMFERSGKGLTRLWLQDGGPSQNSRISP